MKKKYAKPTVFVESFELSQHIAACQNPIKNKNLAVKSGCSADIPSIGDSNVFYTSISLEYNYCTVDGEDMYCYTEGTPDEFVFSS